MKTALAADEPQRPQRPTVTIHATATSGPTDMKLTLNLPGQTPTTYPLQSATFDGIICPFGLGELLTEQEHAALDLTAQLAGAIREIIDQGGAAPSIGAIDKNELGAHLHVIQNAILAQAAARAYPDRYRLLGGPPIAREERR